ncbi:O-methyltransferase [Rufibacter sediminis]|uniref:O-methyltransferase n=1 Tax=Rufibacter sediminis TaxID=2762756 RepID=A0ABR6VS09_9BACT|nr:O-methyltransferase [Rufibacter sediminis]MBC3539952.1 O-methyltransferase [Rufibacter sediminis]
MDFLDPDLNAYAEAHTSPETPLLHQLNRETHLKVMKPRMLSGHLQGRTLAMFSQMLRPRRILEIGTYTGYSALCLAEGLTEDGVLHTIDVNDELEDMVRGYIGAAGLEQKIQLHIGQAAEVIPTLQEQWDLVFIDADKKSNGLYYDLVLDSVRPGGFILTDNVLWSGKVVEKFRPKLDKDTELVLDFNRKVHEDPRVENLLLPMRDGILVARKK